MGHVAKHSKNKSLHLFSIENKVVHIDVNNADTLFGANFIYIFIITFKKVH